MKKTKPRGSTPRPTSTRSWVKTGVANLYRVTGKRKVSFVYKYPDNHSETFTSATVGDRAAITTAENIAKRKALDVQQGRIVAGSVGEMINRFIEEVAPDRYADQSKHGIAVRTAQAQNLKRFFGKMSPRSVQTIHGYQYLERRAAAGAPAVANKEMSLMSTICRQGVKWGLMASNPFVDMEMNVTDSFERVIDRRQVLRFYLWALRQRPAYRTMGIAAMFSYLTGFRAAEVRPFKKSGLQDDGVIVVNAKRRKGARKVVKGRNWSLRLRVVVARALDRHDKRPSAYLFAATRRGTMYTKSGWTSTWHDAMALYLGVDVENVVMHPGYFAMSNIRPVAITKKLEDRAEDAYDFAAHANPATTHRHYDRRRVIRAKATE